MKNNDYHNLILNYLPESYKKWFLEEKKYLEKWIESNSSVLEVGSGDGRSIFDLIPITKNIVGIDHDEKAIQESIKKFAEFPLIKFIKADAEKLPFEDKLFDYVICMTSFANFSNKKISILNEMKRVLKESGKIVISVFSEKAFPERMKVYTNINIPIKEIRENGTVIFDESLVDNTSEQFTKQELENIFSQVKLKINDITEVSIAYMCTLSKEEI